MKVKFAIFVGNKAVSFTSEKIRGRKERSYWWGNGERLSRKMRKSAVKAARRKEKNSVAFEAVGLTGMKLWLEKRGYNLWAASQHVVSTGWFR